MTLAGNSTGRPLASRWTLLAVLLVGALAMTAWGASGAAAGPAQEEYRLDIPDARGDGGSSSPREARSRLSGSGPTGAAPLGSSYGRILGGGSGGYAPSGDGLGAAHSGGGEASGIDEALLAKARQGSDSGLLSAATTAAGMTPLGLAVLGGLLLVTIAGALAARRRGRAKAEELL